MMNVTLTWFWHSGEAAVTEGHPSDDRQQGMGEFHYLRILACTYMVVANVTDKPPSLASLAW